MSGIRDNAPTVTNDSGTGRDGTPADSTWYEAFLDAIDDEVLAATNPTIKPKTITDEVVAARGTVATLDTRLDVSLNEDGTLKATAVAGLATVTQLLGGIGGTNLIMNDDFLLWPTSDSAVTDGDVLAGTGVAIARSGTALGDTTRKIGDFAAKVTRGTTDATLTRTVLTGTAFTRSNWIIGLYAAGGAWVKCSTVNAARLAIYDGVGYTYSSYHTGGGTWEWLPVTRAINVAADRLSLICQVNNSAVAAYFSGRTLMLIDSDLDLPRYVPCPVIYGTFHFAVSGVVAAATNIGRLIPSRSGITKDIQLHTKTCPTGQALIVDVNTWDGAAPITMCTTKPQILDGTYDAGGQPDGTYARRCFVGWSGGPANLPVGGQILVDVDQVGSGVAGADLTIEVRAMQYQSVLERFQTY
jgi:hypothetical protein